MNYNHALNKNQRHPCTSHETKRPKYDGAESEYEMRHARMPPK
jgi:hypothetical protein